MKIFINAGHYDKDQGTTGAGYAENKLAMMTRDALKLILDNRECRYVPDDLNLRGSIDWTNEWAAEDDFAIDIHFNANNNRSIRGAEAYFVEDNKYAKVFSREIASILKIPNRGPKPDSQSYLGSLGWLRQLKCPSVIVECCYLSNPDDINALDTEKIAQGIKNAIDVLFPIVADQSILNKKITELQQVIRQLLAFISNYLKK